MEKIISKCRLKLSHVRFEYRMDYLMNSSINFLKEKYGKNANTLNTSYPFLLNSFLELSIRSQESIILPYSNGEINKIFSDTNNALFNSQNSFLKNKKGLNNFGILFSLWEFEEQEDLFVKLYRYNYFFNYKNDKLDLKKIFEDKFGISYKDFKNFCCSVLILCVFSNQSNFWEYFKIIKDTYPGVIENISIGYKEYLKNSISVCPNIENIALSLKISQSFPFIKKDNILFFPLPHCCFTACTKSLLYRLTRNDDNLRKAIGKETLEDYIFNIVNKSGVYDFVSKEVFFDRKKQKLSPDVMCFKNDEMLGIECKLITPSVEVRYLNEEAILWHRNKIIDFICQLYKSLFINYSLDGNDLKYIDINKRYGIVLLFERMDFDHRIIMKEAALKLKLTEDETIFLYNHIRFDVLYDFECLTFLKGNAIEEIKSMIINNSIFDFSISKSSSNKFYVHEDFVKEKKKMFDLNNIFSNKQN